MPPTRQPRLATLAADLAAGRTSAMQLIEDCLTRIEDPAGEGARAFTRVYRDQALAAAEASDRLRHRGVVAGPLAGIPISIKDLFDVAGQPTLAGSRLLADAPPATVDAPVVTRLRQAGAIIVGKTNMTEFAFSGLGLNPHYGTPANPWDAARIPGGSSSGAGVAGPYGFAAASIGTDTGGSVRIPAAFCRVTGFKPTSSRVPRAGVLPLSTSLDSIGPLAASVECCALVDAVIAGEAPTLLPDLPLRYVRLGVPVRSVLFDGLDETVAKAIEQAFARLSAGGAQLIDCDLTELGSVNEIIRLGGIAGPEAFAWHRALLAARGDHYDPRVRSRLELCRHISAADYITALTARAAAIEAFTRATQPFDALICPTVVVVPPLFADLTRDADYFTINGRVLRNTSIFNMLDCPALSLPCSAPDSLPVGLMVVGERGLDHRLFAIGRAIEAALEPAGEVV